MNYEKFTVLRFPTDISENQMEAALKAEGLLNEDGTLLYDGQLSQDVGSDHFELHFPVSTTE